ncbi:hypothetical protein [Iodidimonas sp. SYSU 1G8]|uniref:hypothetical protein n=1 Tax=Iodidimonas sp. SYSU 1G8 TaxID=3133967 RepID=UPI0031FEE496
MIIAPRIIAVDDNIEHLRALEQAFDGLGGLCECIEFERANNRTVPFATGVRILFMDINLLPGAAANLGPRTFSPIVTIVRKLISPNNGPYALVTWTANGAAHEALTNYLEEHLAEDLRPCATYCLSKDGHLDDPPRLMEKLRDLHGDIPGLAMLLDWERAVTNAADRSVLQIAKLSGRYGRQRGDAVAQAVQAISRASAGAAEADRNPFRAFTRGMSAVLTDQMDSSAPVPNTETAWKAALQASPPPAPDDQQRAALNTFFHIENSPDNAGSALGAIFDAPFALVKNYLGPAMKTKQAALLSKEFVPLKQNRLETNQAKQAFSKACKFRFIQLGAPCDHSNGKLRVLDGLLAVAISESAFDDTDLKNGGQFRDTPAKSEWLFQTPPLLAASRRYVLLVNLRFRIGLPLSQTLKLKRVGRLREALASEIATHSANFSTRPGIIEFR